MFLAGSTGCHRVFFCGQEENKSETGTKSKMITAFSINDFQLQKKLPPVHAVRICACLICRGVTVSVKLAKFSFWCKLRLTLSLDAPSRGVGVSCTKHMHCFCVDTTFPPFVDTPQSSHIQPATQKSHCCLKQIRNQVEGVLTEQKREQRN